MINLVRTLLCIVILAISAFGITAAAKQMDGKDTKNKDHSYEMMVDVHFGHSKTSYTIKSAQGKHKIRTVLQDGGARVGYLTDTDFNFVVSEFENLKVAQVIPNECSMSYVEIRVKVGTSKLTKKASCIVVHTVTSQQYVRFLNILNLAI